MADHSPQATVPMDLDSREYFNRRIGAMKMLIKDFIPHYQELSLFVMPRRGRFLSTDVNKGSAAYTAIINGHATRALRTARSGLFAGTMSPSRRWFQMVVADPEAMERSDVKIWLELAERILRDIFNQGNLYAMSPTMLGELLLYGTGCMTHVDDFEDVARFYTHTIGSYMIAQNDRFEVDTLVRHFMRSTAQIVKQFGLDSVGTSVRTAWDSGNYDTQFPVVNFIEPNPNFREDKGFEQFMPFRSVHFQEGLEEKNFLGIRGFHEFPAYCPRWEVTGEDIYATDCPGMTALGDTKGLQTEERRKAQGIDRTVNPPLHGPPSVANVPHSSMPGGLTTYDAQGTHVLRPIFEVRLQLAELMADIAAVENRIDGAFYVDLFKAITNMEGIQPRNERELLERNQERLLELSPALERVHGDFLAKMVERTFRQVVRAGEGGGPRILPPAPEAIQGAKLSVRFISSLAMAQRAVAVGSIERIAQFAGSLAEIWPGAADKLDPMQMIDEYGQAIGVPARIIVPDEDVKRAQEAKAQEKQMLMAQEAAKELGPVVTQAVQISDQAGRT